MLRLLYAAWDRSAEIELHPASQRRSMLRLYHDPAAAEDDSEELNATNVA